MLPHLTKSLIFFRDPLPHNTSGLYVASLVATSGIFRTSRIDDGRKLREKNPGVASGVTVFVQVL
jgi:hypothetical protein